MSDQTVFEFEEYQSAEEVAAMLQGVVDGFEAETELTFGDDVTVPAPSSLSVAIELETDTAADGTEQFELELELEWDETDVSDSSSLDGVLADADESSTAAESADETETTEQKEAIVHLEEDEIPLEETTEPAVVETEDLSSLARFQIYRDRGDKWRWRLIHRNGNIIATSGQGYTTKWNAKKGLRSVVANAPAAEVGED